MLLLLNGNEPPMSRSSFMSRSGYFEPSVSRSKPSAPLKMICAAYNIGPHTNLDPTNNRFSE